MLVRYIFMGCTLIYDLNLQFIYFVNFVKATIPLLFLGYVNVCLYTCMLVCGCLTLCIYVCMYMFICVRRTCVCMYICVCNCVRERVCDVQLTYIQSHT